MHVYMVGEDSGPVCHGPAVGPARRPRAPEHRPGRGACPAGGTEMVTRPVNLSSHKLAHLHTCMGSREGNASVQVCNFPRGTVQCASVQVCNSRTISAHRPPSVPKYGPDSRPKRRLIVIRCRVSTDLVTERGWFDTY